MKCDACGAQWETNESGAPMKFCPYCGENIAGDTTLEQVFKTGIAPFRNQNNPVDRLIALATQGFEERLDEISPNDLYNLAGMYLYGRGGKQVDKERAVKYLKMAAEGGHPHAAFMLADCYMSGDGVEKDQKRGVDLYETAAKWSNPYLEEWHEDIPEWNPAPAFLKLGYIYTGGVLGEPDTERGFKNFEKAAQWGDTDAYVSLYKSCANGWGTPPDKETALEWLQKAADRGHPEAMMLLGIHLINGDGLKTDEEKGLELIRVAAAQNYPQAQNMYGNCLYNGICGNPDPAAALTWYKKAAVQGFAEAQYNVAAAYLNGEGTAKDEKKAFEWFEKAAAQNMPNAMEELRKMYRDGIGVKQDLEKADELWQSLNEMGYYNK